MNNLFFVHTPLQLVIAQQLIHQEKLCNNILLYGYIDDNKHFLDIYDLLIIQDLWADRIFFEQLPACADLSLHSPLRCFFKIKYNINRLETIIREQDIDNVYIGDIDNIGYQFLMFYFKGKVKVNIFEEGTSHYCYKKRESYNRRFQRMQELILDYFYYLPFYRIRFARYWFRDGDYDRIPMNSRFSILPGYYNEPFDKLLIIDPDFQSIKLREYLRNEIQIINKCENLVFLITSKVYGHQKNEYYNQRYDAYLQTIKEFADRLPSNCTIAIKLHPRENEETGRDIIKVLEQKRIPSFVLSKDINLPVELYLQILQPNKIIAFSNSSTMYNGFLYPKCEIIDLISDFLHICSYKGYYIDDLKRAYLK